MSRVHDMGGRFGDGPVDPGPEDAPVFAEEWHARALAITLASGGLGLWTLDASRHARECLPPAEYMQFSYYEKWIAALIDLLHRNGAIDRAELAGAAPVVSPLADRRLTADRVPGVLSSGAPTDRPGQGPASIFAPGDAVRTRMPARNAQIPGGHTRLPAYAAGQRGRVIRAHGPHVLPDMNAHGLGEQPEPLYTVAFDAADLWGTTAHPADSVRLDLWQSYLVSA